MADLGPDERERDDAERLRRHIRNDIHERIQDRMERRWRRRHTGFGGLVVGLIIAGIGVLLLLQNLGILFIEDLWRYWPVILIVIGVSRTSTCLGFGGRVWGGVLVFAGTILLLHNLDIIHGNLWRFVWPTILIAVGMGMLARGLERRRYWARESLGRGNPAISSSGSPLNRLNEWAIFGGIRRRIESQEFEGGEALAIFGGVELDLRPAATKKDEIVLEANAMFGGIELRVPDTWKVDVRGAGIFGGYEDKTLDTRSVHQDDKRPHLVVTGYAFFGGVTVH